MRTKREFSYSIGKTRKKKYKTEPKVLTLIVNTVQKKLENDLVSQVKNFFFHI